MRLTRARTKRSHLMKYKLLAVFSLVKMGIILFQIRYTDSLHTSTVVVAIPDLILIHISSILSNIMENSNLIHHHTTTLVAAHFDGELKLPVLRACSHEPWTVYYPSVMITPRQALPRVHMIICCPWATSPPVNFTAQGQVHCHLITTNLSEFL